MDARCIIGLRIDEVLLMRTCASLENIFAYNKCLVPGEERTESRIRIRVGSNPKGKVESIKCLTIE